jgi:flagellar protein FlgJ
VTAIPALSTVASTSTADTSRLSSKENLKEAADKFEAVFIGMMLKSMRATKLSDGLFDNNATQQFRDMQDDKLAQSMAANAPLGLGKAMSDFLSRGQPALGPDVKVSAGSAVTPDVTGGTS